jgi:dATP pyrophosphohydrolase
MPKIVSPLVSAYCFRLVTQGPEYLALHRREGIDRLGGSWQSVHGGIERGETAVQAAWREIREETGVTPLGFWELDYVEAHYIPEQDAIRLIPCFAARFPKDVALTLGPEHDDHRWLPIGELLDLMRWRSQREAFQVLHETIALPLFEGRPLNSLLVIPPELCGRES